MKIKIGKLFNIVFLVLLFVGVGYGVVTRVTNTYMLTDEINATRIYSSLICGNSDCTANITYNTTNWIIQD